MDKDHGIDGALMCPKSGQLLGVLVSAFRLDDREVGGVDAARNLDRSTRPTKGYFAGEWVGDEQRRQVCTWTAQALVHSGVIGNLSFVEDEAGHKPHAESVIAAAIYTWLCRWDAEFHVVASRSPHADQVLGGFVLGRHIVLDLALRWAAAIVLTGGKAPRESPQWCSESGGATILRALLDEFAPNESLDTCAKMFGVDPRTLDRWLSRESPLIPLEGNLARIASALTAKAGVSADDLRVGLRREYGMFYLVRELALCIGWSLSSELGHSLVRFVRMTLEDFGNEPASNDFLGNLELSFVEGAALPLNAVVLDEWLRRDLGPLWDDDVRAARDGQLEARLTGCFGVIGMWHSATPMPMPPDLAPLWEQRSVQESAALWAMNDNRPNPNTIRRSMQQGQVFYRIPARDDATRIANRVMQASACMQQKDYHGAMVHWARVVALEPTSARYRFFYGVMLWLATRNYEDATKELHESCRLDPEWDRPFVEIAIIWLNRGMPDMALHHLQSQGERFRPRSDHFNHHEGIALRLLGRLDEALAAFELATALKLDHGAAFDLAADCAFKLFDKTKGKRYAKRAFDLGHGESFRLWNV